MTETAKGVGAIILACTIWGLSGLFYKLLAGLPVLDILAHRTLWGAVFFLLILGVQGRVGAPLRVLRGRGTLRILAGASVLIALNWMLFVWAIKSGQALEASLGYYIFPLVAVLFGLLFFGERLRRAEALAVLLAALAVAVLTAGLGVAPWIALSIAASFGAYGALKKHLDVGPVVSVTAESLLLATPALAWLVWSAVQGGAVTGDPGRWR
ncbi:EamA family transporter RarD [Roseovarius sp. B08]|uniref:EamA family transporter RarD n=1 Tax=Roseovarius sp. B08 TaxID=3449223 RepID=UPI003EDC340E